MKAKIDDDFGVLIARDKSLACPGVVEDWGEESRARVREMAKAGDLFFIDREDPIRMLVQVVTEETPPQAFPEKLYRTVAGNYLVHLPSGVLKLQGLGAWIAGNSTDAESDQLEPGAYSIEALELESHDLTAYDEHMSDLVGLHNWNFRNRVDRLYFLGCLPTIIAVVLTIFSTLKLGLYAGLVAAVLWLPYLISIRSRRYRSIIETVSSTESGLPLFILRLRRLHSTEGIVGGYF